jgi:hypothetical protein
LFATCHHQRTYIYQLFPPHQSCTRQHPTHSFVTPAAKASNGAPLRMLRSPRNRDAVLACRPRLCQKVGRLELFPTPPLSLFGHAPLVSEPISACSPAAPPLGTYISAPCTAMISIRPRIYQNASHKGLRASYCRLMHIAASTEAVRRTIVRKSPEGRTLMHGVVTL